MSSAELVDLVDAQHMLLQQVQAAMLATVRELDARNVAAEMGAPSTGLLLRGRLRVAAATGQRWVRLAKTVDTAPTVVQKAAACGAVNADQIQAITTILRQLAREVESAVVEQAAARLVDDAGSLDADAVADVGRHVLRLVAPELAEQAERKAVERAERLATRDRFLNLRPDRDGVGVAISGRLTEEAAAVVQEALDPLCAPAPGDDRTAGQRRADALRDVCGLALNTEQLPDNGGDRPQLIVTANYDALGRELGAGTLDNGAGLSAEAVRRLACDALILPASLDGAGQLRDLGRFRRLFTGPIRRALVLRDRHCAWPGCDRPARWCDGHHIVAWSHGGDTCLDNSLLLCGHHHREIHKPDGWTVHIAPDGLPTFIPPAWLDPERKPQRNHCHRP
jgi:Domain of unknown function (DUF222)